MKTNWIKIYECPILKPNSKIWLQELLESNNIPFNYEIKTFWEGSIRTPSYRENLIIYIPTEFKSQVENFIKEYDNMNNILANDIEELKTDDDTEFEAKAYAKKQRMMLYILIGIIIAMISTFFISGLFSK